jgi:uncharacterized protein YjdB
MKVKLLNVLTAGLLFLIPKVNYGQAPTMGTAASFVLFTTNGAMTCSGTKYLTHLTGNVGSNLAGSVTGFGNVDGVMHAFDVATGVCASDVISLYTQLSTAIPTGTLASPFGNGVILTPGIYSIPMAATLNLDITLDAVGNPNAVFIFKIGGVFTTNASAKVKLINGAMACNVFWQVGGAVNIGTGTFMRGTIVANGQIDMTSTLDTLEGRALALNAPVLASQLVAYTPIGCGSPYLTGPAAPALASTAAYGVFSSIGAVTSTPVTYVIGDVGANSTTPTGFNPLNVTGTIHAMDPSTAAAAGDLTNVYNYLVAMPADINLLDPADFGHDLVLTPHSYQVTGITQLTGNLILNAEGNPNAVFVIKINGALTTSTLSRIILINGTKAKNVYWKVDGAVDIFSNSVFNGTLVVAGAISLETGDTLDGRALTINGAIAINGSYVNNNPPPCVAAPIAGLHQVCVGNTILLSDADNGGTWSSSNPAVASVGSSSGIVTGATAGIDTIIYTSSLACVNTTTVTVNSSPSAISGPGAVCASSSVVLSDATLGGNWSSSNTSVATVGSLSGIVSGVTAGTASITYTLPAGCFATKTMTVNSTSSAGTISGPSIVCPTQVITLTDGAAGGVWTASNAHATVAGGIVTGVTAGVDTIIYTVTSGCGNAIATKTITVTSSPGAGIISGPSIVCPASTITLTDGVAGGVWSVSNIHATVAGGIVTGVTAGVDTIMYTVASGCGPATATKTVTVTSTTNAGTISGPSSVCPASIITLTDGVAGGVWSATNIHATVAGGIVTGVTAGVDTIIYTVTDGCGTAIATTTVTVNSLPNAGTISGPSGVCVASVITLTDGVTGGVWSARNIHATVANGIVTGVTAGIDTIMYTVTNGCGKDTATKIVTVNPLPNAGTISGPSGVCVASVITLTDGVAGGVWSSSNATAIVGSTGVVTGVTAGVDSIIYTVTNGCGTDRDTMTVTVNPLPNAGIITGASSVCVGSSVTETDLANSGAWTMTNGTATVSGGVVTGVFAGMDTIMYSVSNICGTATAAKTIIVNPLPNAGTITGISNVCIGMTIALTDVVTVGTWSSSSNATATVGSTGVVTGVAAGTDVIVYSVTNMCGTATATKTITVNQLPAAPIMGSTATSAVCDSTFFQNFGTATLPAAGVKYSWSAVNAKISDVGTTGQYALVNFKTPGIAVITVTSTIVNTGCATNSDGYSVNVGTQKSDVPPQVVYFTKSFVCLQNNEEGYQWGYDDAATLAPTTIQGEINQDYVISNPDVTNKNYWVKITHNGCVQKAYYNKPTGAALKTSITEVKIFPNPAQDNVTVEVNTTEPGNVQVEVLNMIGQKLYVAAISGNSAQMNVSAFPAGIYMVICYRDGIKISSARFIKN